MNVAKRLKLFAKTKGGVNELAGVLELTQSGFSRYTSGANLPGALILSKLAKVGCNINWLLTGQGYMALDEKDEITQEQIDAVYKLRDIFGS